MFSPTLLIAGLFVLSFALRAFHHPALHRLGNFSLICATYYSGWEWTGSHGAAAVLAFSWFLLPWVDIVGRVRRMELPAERPLEPHVAPSHSRFPDLETLTEELEAEGFQTSEDAEWSGDDQQQFVRIMPHASEGIRATIHFVETAEVAFYFVAFHAKTEDGRSWYTWNYPFPSTLKSSPRCKIQRLRNCDSLLEMLEEHRAWLTREGVSETAPVPSKGEDQLRELNEELKSQIAHNVQCGMLVPMREGIVKYSWKGCFFLWFQLVREMIGVN